MFLGFLKSVTLQLKGNWPKPQRHGSASWAGLAGCALSRIFTGSCPGQGADPAGRGNRGKVDVLHPQTSYTSHQALAQHFQIKCGVTFSLTFFNLNKKYYLFFFWNIYLLGNFFSRKSLCFASKNLFLVKSPHFEWKTVSMNNLFELLTENWININSKTY